MKEVVEALQGLGGYSTTVTLWVFFFLAAWRGLPGVMAAIDKTIDAITNRQSQIEKRMADRLAESDARYMEMVKLHEEQFAAERKRYAEERDRHEECMERQEELYAMISRLRQTSDELQETIVGMRRQMGQVGLSTIRMEGQPVPPIIQDAAVRAAIALENTGKSNAENGD